MTTKAQKPVPPQEDLELGEPYCGACGHRLTGLVDSSKCPECGRPIIDVLTRAGKLGTRYRSQTTLFGLPLIDVALGGTHNESTGSARGVFAVGDSAKGFVAMGGKATGIVALGGRAVGVFSVGGISFGLVSSWGGISIGAMASGGIVLALLGFGGLCAGVVTSGGVSLGVYAFGGTPFGYLLNQAEVYQSFSWFLGPPRLSVWTFLQPTIAVLVLPVVAALFFAILATARHVTAGREDRALES
jgi:predicted RNA-binding Zn-ribbon protein involved in translation (DUF1610 family)